MDSPFHRYADGKDLSELPLESLANLECLVVWHGGGRAIERVPFGADEVRGRAVLFRTGWDRHWRTEQYFTGHPYLTGALAEWLARAGAALVGIDSLNIDSTRHRRAPVHSTAAAAGRSRSSSTCAASTRCPSAGGRLFAVPVKLKRVGTFPVRAFVIA